MKTENQLKEDLTELGVMEGDLDAVVRYVRERESDAALCMLRKHRNF